MARFCPNCGAPLNEGAKFCGSCGASLADVLQPAARPATSAPTAATYQCPNCGGVMTFDAASGHVVCNHCGHVYERGEAERAIPVSDAPVARGETAHAKTVADFLERAPWQVEAAAQMTNSVTYSCPSCAAEVVADQSTVATACPYCGNNMLVSGIATADNIPQQVLPFSVTREQAEERMREHFRHKWYLSRAFDARLAHLQGVYVPYHLYDMSVRGRADYIGYYETSPDDNGNTVKYYYAIKRAGHASFEKIPVDGSSKMPDGHMDAIAPFDFTQLQDFSAGYAAGYLMEVADEDAEQCLPRAERRARATRLRTTLRPTRGASGAWRASRRSCGRRRARALRACRRACCPCGSCTARGTTSRCSLP